MALALKRSGFGLRLENAGLAGASIPMGQGGHVPPIPNIWTGGTSSRMSPNISRVISATFYPCNIFMIS